MAEVLRLKLECKEIEVILEDSNGDEKKYTLRELTGKERNKYLNKMSNRMKVDRNGKAMGIKSFDGFQADLLKASLSDGDGEAVPEDEIEDMPSGAQQELFDMAQKLSGLDNDPDSEEKN